MIVSNIEAPDIEPYSGPKAITVEIHKLRQLSKIIRALGTGGWIFRGHESKDWHLSSSLEREFSELSTRSSSAKANKASSTNCSGTRFGDSDEMYAIDSFRRYSQSLLKPLNTEVEWLAAMQHYGAPTRLVDFSRSLYVALYFAFQNRHEKSTRAIYAIRFKDLIHNNTIRGDLISVLVNEYSSKYRHSPESAEEYREFIETEYYKNQLALQTTLIDLASQCIRKELTQDIDGVIPVHVPGANDRLTAQSGLFLLPRTFNSFEDNLSASLGVAKKEVFEPSCTIADDAILAHGVTDKLRRASYLKLVFDEIDLSNSAIWNMLDQANVSAMNLFPGLEGIAKSIRYGEPLFSM